MKKTISGSVQIILWSCLFATPAISGEKWLTTSNHGNKSKSRSRKNLADQLTVTIYGLNGDILKNVRLRLEADAEPLKQQLSKSNVRQYIRRIPKEVQDATSPFGYFEPQVKATLHEDQHIDHVQVYIKQGKPVINNKIQVIILGQGSTDKKFIKYLTKLPMKPGDIFNSDQYKTIKNSLFDIASNRGYFNAKVTTSRAKINLDRHIANINITFDTGPRFRFGKTTFTPTPLAVDFLQRYRSYTPGDYYNNNKIQQMQSGLHNSEYFNQVSVTPDLNKIKPGHDYVPIDVKLKTAPSQSYTIGGGWGSDSGVRALLMVNMRRIGPYGHKFKAKAQFSQNIKYLDSEYIIPGLHPATEDYTLHALIGKEDMPYGKSKLLEVGASYQSSVWNWTQIIDLSALTEQYELTDPVINTNTTLLIPSIRWNKLYARPLLMAKRGFHISAQLSAAPIKISKKSAKFFQARLKAKTLYTLKSNTRLVLRGQIVYTAIKNDTQLPLSLQPMTGGSNSIRGYAYNTIYGGKNMLIGSAEVQQKIYGSIYLAGFYDTGTVTDSLGDAQYYSGAGPGIVLLTQIGEISITVAKPLVPPPGSDKKKWRVQFSINPIL